MAIIFDIIDQKSWQRKFSESLDVSANWALHYQKLSDCWVFVDSIEYCSSSLRMTKHGKISFIVESLKNFLEHLKRKSLDCFLTAFGLAISWAINGNDVELLKVRNPNKILLEKIGINIRWIFWARPMHNKDKRLSRYSCSDGVDVAKRGRYAPRCDLLKFLSKVDVIFLDHFLYINKEF